MFTSGTQHERRELINEMAETIWHKCFSYLDEYPEFTSQEAGFVASQVEEAFKKAIAELE